MKSNGFREMRNEYRTLVRKREGKRPPGRTGGRWEYNIEMYLKETVGGYGISCGTEWERVADFCEHDNS